MTLGLVVALESLFYFVHATLTASSTGLLIKLWRCVLVSVIAAAGLAAVVIVHCEGRAGAHIAVVRQTLRG